MEKSNEEEPIENGAFKENRPFNLIDMALVWITKANYVEDFKVELTFNDGVSGIVDLKNHLNGKVFEPLKNVEFFKKFEIDSWTLTWPNDSDFAPEFLYDLTQKQNEKARSIV